MKDLDFDELDKAVNSLMSKSETVSEEPAIAVNVTSRPVTPTPSLFVPTPMPASSSIQVVSLNSNPKPAPIVSRPVSRTTLSPERSIQSAVVPSKRSGRFMDLVSSSSDSQSPMKSSTPTSRQGVRLSPVSENITLESPTVVATSEPVSVRTPQVSTPPKREFPRQIPGQSVSPLAASMTMGSRTKHDDMPDPLDVHLETQGSNEIDLLETGDITKTATAPVSAFESPKNVASQTINEPAPVSPFLTDAKVDKRPLGNANAVNEPTLGSTTLNDSPQGQSKGSIPAELNTDLLAVESDRVEAATPARTASPMRPQRSPELTSPISIAQQYKQQPRTGDQSHAAVYDTAAHPVTHPVKKKSHLLIVVVIALIILLGGGGVAVLFALGYI